jgi:GntR family transcriptional regulator
MALAHLSELPLRLDRKAGGPAYAQIVAQINCLILSEQLSAGDVLPQIRRLAVQLGVNPNTVVRAYDELEQSGLICKRQGSACRVATIPNEPKSIHQRMQGIRPLMDALVNTSRSVGVPIPLLMEELAKYEVHPPEPPGRPRPNYAKSAIGAASDSRYRNRPASHQIC